MLDKCTLRLVAKGYHAELWKSYKRNDRGNEINDLAGAVARQQASTMVDLSKVCNV